MHVHHSHNNNVTEETYFTKAKGKEVYDEGFWNGFLEVGKTYCRKSLAFHQDTDQIPLSLLELTYFKQCGRNQCTVS